MGLHYLLGLFFVFVGLNILDLSTTFVALRLGAREANPLARWLLKKFDFNGLIWMKVLALNYILIASVFLESNRVPASLVLLIGNFVYLGVVVNNFNVIRKRKKLPRRDPYDEFVEPLLPI